MRCEPDEKSTASRIARRSPTTVGAGLRMANSEENVVKKKKRNDEKKTSP